MPYNYAFSFQYTLRLRYLKDIAMASFLVCAMPII